MDTPLKKQKHLDMKILIVQKKRQKEQQLRHKTLLGLHLFLMQLPKSLFYTFTCIYTVD